jgi:hypothetical protein
LSWKDRTPVAASSVANAAMKAYPLEFEPGGQRFV